MESRSLLVSGLVIVWWLWTCQGDGLDLDEVMTDAELEDSGSDVNKDRTPRTTIC